MRKRILAGSVWLVVFAIIICALVAGFILQYRLLDEMEGGLRDLVQALAANLNEPDNFEQAAQDLSEQTGGLRITFISEDGQLLADSEPGADAFDDIIEKEEFVQARVGGVGFATRASKLTGHQMMYAASHTQHGFYIRVAREYSGFWAGVFALLPALLVGGMLVMLMIVPVSFTFASSIQSPIVDFSQNINKVMAGNEKLDPDKYQFEELQEMAISINHLSDEVDEAFQILQRERVRIDTILNSMNEGFVMLSWDEEVLLINDTAARILGFVRGTENNSLVYLTHDIELLDAVAEVKKTGTVHHVDFVAADGSSYEVAISPTIPEPTNDMQGLVLLLSDMADNQSTNKVRQEFFASASHELKTPITSVRGFAELLMSGAIQGEEQRADCAERILKETRRMETLIEDILMIARMESGEIRYEREVLDMTELVRDYCTDIEGMAYDAQVSIRFEGDLCRMYASRKEMRELVGNLVTNAIKYNYPGGRVEVRLWVEDGSPLLSVFNTGDAIPEGDKEHIFERFYRVDKGRSRAVGGTGLGLAIVKHIVGRYGAKVSLIPLPGIGNTFEVAFPPSISQKERGQQY